MKRYKHRPRLKTTNYLTILFLTVSIYLSTVATARKSKKPVFVEDPRSQTVEDLSSVSLICRANGIPSPQITWQKKIDNQWVILNNGIVDGTAIVDGGDLNFLSVSKGGKRGQFSDDGEYRCIADNGVGSPVASKSAELIVACKY